MVLCHVIASCDGYVMMKNDIRTCTVVYTSRSSAVCCLTIWTTLTLHLVSFIGVLTDGTELTNTIFDV